MLKQNSVPTLSSAAAIIRVFKIVFVETYSYSLIHAAGHGHDEENLKDSTVPEI